MIDKSLRIEQALRFWEDVCFISSKKIAFLRQVGESMPCPVAGPLANYSNFRKHMLESIDPAFDLDKYMNPQETVKYLSEVAWIPLGIFGWNYDSRRVFHLSQNIQMLLSATRLNTASLETIHLPFESFAVTLSDPLVDGKGNQYDCIMLSDVGKHCSGFPPGALMLTLFSENLANIRPLGMIEKERLIKGLRKRDSRVMGLLNELDDRFGNKVADHIFLNLETLQGETYSCGPDLNTDPLFTPTTEAGVDWDEFEKRPRELPGSSSSGATDEDKYLISTHIEQAIHLIASLCLYLASLPPQEASQLEWQRTVKIPGQSERVITRESQICTVSCEHSLTAGDRAVLNEISLTRKSFTMCVHWRRGFWRRARGSGHDPDAPRTVWVRPTLVNRNRLPENALPVGSKTNLS